MKKTGSKSGRVRIYFEGGGSTSRQRDVARAGLAEFLEQVFRERKPMLIACGPRNEAYDKFCRALIDNKEDELLLLVDSEAPVTRTPWAHVATQAGGGWLKPSKATDDKLHFMAQCMEAWILADPDAVRSFYARDVHVAALKVNQNVEAIPPADAEKVLRRASRDTPKGAYDKGSHSFALLGTLNPAKVQARASHAKRLFDTLAQLGMR